MSSATLQTPSDSQQRLDASAESVVPNSLKFLLPRIGPPGQRKEFRIPPLSSTYQATGGDNVVRFHFNNSNLLDFRRGYLGFDLTISGGNGTYARIAQGVWSIFNRIRLTTGKELDDLREYNRWHSMMFEVLRDEDIGDVLGPSCFGYATQAVRNANGATTTSYAMPLMVGFFLSGMVPMGIFKQKLQLELYLENPANCCESDSTAPLNITLTNIYFHYEVIRLTDALESSIASMAMSGLVYPFKKYTYYTQPTTSALFNAVIPHVGGGIETIVSYFYETDNRTNMTVNDKFLTWMPGTLTQRQLRINNDYYPMEPINCGVGTQWNYITFVRWLGKWKLGGQLANPPSTSSLEFYTSRMLMIDNLQTHPGEGLINRLSTEGAGTNIVLQLKSSASPAVPTSLETWVISYATINFAEGRLS